ncbi:unnamed protein product (macronuclear) [Paramecium tetraurelia]|uniref:Transmembrane protein n=1 Tax=Paramecium tetraurelia TaxID=5888 RepID=A0EAB0_PARTE|nr:uncharacterized protein GSPATT00024959001 [Paramecium tetraurelia]CAK92227.1 unnamed protein product [Paramecium tetraurelia]|eukprot:XP_001459624.1 hypothetical protein (macronuclear) [Paramecium tetraurelia strain d4-2]
MISAILSLSFNKEQGISLYPTEGEFYKQYIDQQVADSQLRCKIDPQIPNVQIMNQCEEIYEIVGNSKIQKQIIEFKSMSSNNTHFITLSYENEVIMYEWKNQIIEQVGESITIDPQFNCFNINLSEDFAILVDCYQNHELLLIQLMDEQSIPAYQVQSSIPTSTKMQQIVNGTNNFIVYAQYFKEYSVLSLISSSFQNSSSLKNKFVDFDIPITISPNIYAITSQEILQLSISPDSQLRIQMIYLVQESIMIYLCILNAIKYY